MECPVPFSETDRILLGHGSGGRLTHQLISGIFFRWFDNPLLGQDHDGCIFPVEKGRIACSTDSFVVSPIFFPGGNIGELAVNGTVNDLACCGARPRYLTAGFIIEEGFLLSDLEQIVQSMAHAARKAGVQIVTGDTKVVERGKCDQVFINTSGIGTVLREAEISPSRVQPGDVVICSGPIGVHGIAILSARESLGFQTGLKSDTAPLHGMILETLATVPDIHVLRDPTRGGISSALNEIAQSAGVQIVLDEASLPIPEAVKAASEIFGLDPLYIANEGVVLVLLPEKDAESALTVMRKYPEGRQATVIGKAVRNEQASVRMKTRYDLHRVINMLDGDQLPRIC